MAKSKSALPSPKKSENVYPSPYGSHATMIDAETTAKLNDPAWVVLKDEEGLYATLRERLDNRQADPYRNASVGWKADFLRSKLTA